MSDRPSHMSRSGLLFTACREALVLAAYPDGHHMSWGFGHNDPTLKEGDTLTVREAFELLRRDMASRETVLNRALKVDVSQNQYDAVLDLYYQNGNKPDVDGKPGFTTMMQIVNSGDLVAASAYFEKCYLNSKGERVAGLLTRRKRERIVFDSGDYGDLERIPFYPGPPSSTRQQTYYLKPGDLD